MADSSSLKDAANYFLFACACTVIAIWTVYDGSADAESRNSLNHTIYEGCMDGMEPGSQSIRASVCYWYNSFRYAPVPTRGNYEFQLVYFMRVVWFPFIPLLHFFILAMHHVCMASKIIQSTLGLDAWTPKIACPVELADLVSESFCLCITTVVGHIPGCRV